MGGGGKRESGTSNHAHTSHAAEKLRGIEDSYLCTQFTARSGEADSFLHMRGLIGDTTGANPKNNDTYWTYKSSCQGESV